ncbi:MAG: glycyl-radical enzyme activating protein [Negativicutes bacterium]
MSKTLVLSVQKFSVHDGPGIRTTVFFKGCPLRCAWCHNPESQNFTADLMTDSEKCTGCGSCVDHCHIQAISVSTTGQATDRCRCDACGECVDFCRTGAREIAGHAASEAELLAEILKDQIFYEQSGGGVTFSGGEALCHIDALESLAAQCKLHGLHVAIDTCGYVPQDHFRRILPHADLFLYDLKHMDAERHRHYTGQDNRLILENIGYLSEAGAAICLRLPLIENVNDDPDNIEEILRFSKQLRLRQVNLLPYHNTGSSKYAKLGYQTQSVILTAPAPQRLEAIQRQFEAAGMETRIGG